MEPSRRDRDPLASADVASARVPAGADVRSRGEAFEAAPRSTRGEGLMAAAIRTQTVEATVTVRVSQAAGGDLAAGARRQLDRVDGVTVDELSIAGIRPGLNDTTVEAVATLSVDDRRPVTDPDRETDADPPDGVTDRVAARLADGFGVEPERVERVERG